MIGAIILAAGESRRMGKQKLLLPYAGKTVVEHIVDQVLASEVDSTVVVTGHDRDGVIRVLADRELTFAHNSRYTEGMLTSIRVGLAVFPPDLEAFLVVLGDQPSLTPAIINALIEAFRREPQGIIVPFHDDDTGHPVLIASKYREQVMTQFDDTGLRGLIYGRPDEVVKLPIGTSDVLRDMDTPEDYERELKFQDSAPLRDQHKGV
ncbi:MAG: molybdenum cofactor cytidylyltransferase [Candidatus Hydrogenedentes bacterium]|nr:molybdenum cofactor cytidylyltransferase [Candidatus Hydrogenedentota bacterium]